MSADFTTYRRAAVTVDCANDILIRHAASTRACRSRLEYDFGLKMLRNRGQATELGYENILRWSSYLLVLANVLSAVLFLLSADDDFDTSHEWHTHESYTLNRLNIHRENHCQVSVP